MAEKKPLSQVASKIYRITKESQEGYQGIKEYHAPRECGEFIRRGTKREILEALDEGGFSPRGFIEACQEIIPEKSIYYLFHEVLDLIPENH